MQDLGRKKRVVALFLEGIVLFFSLFLVVKFLGFRYESYIWAMNNGICVVLTGLMRLKIISKKRKEKKGLKWR